jgi:hypothetical protein
VSAVGYWYTDRTDGVSRSTVLAASGAAATVGSLVGVLALRVGTGAAGYGSVAVQVATLAGVVALDSVLFGLLVVAGVAFDEG